MTVTESNRQGPLPPMGGLQLADPDAQRLVQLLAGALSVQRRYQFFVWSQSHLNWLLPHQVMLCASWRRSLRRLHFELFNSLPIEPALEQALTDPQGPLLTRVVGEWLSGNGGPRTLDLATLEVGEAGEWARLLRQRHGFSHLAVHGVSRPQRRLELETLFLIPLRCAEAASHRPVHAELWLELLLPTLHSTWLRVVANENQFLRASAPSAEPRPSVPAARAPEGQVTERERQILASVQRGLSNQQIAEQLGISPLTVKNHIQKILRKLGAHNRAQAVSMAIARGTLATDPFDSTRR